MKNQNVILENKVEARTRELTLSQQKLEASMNRAKQLAVEADKANRSKSMFLANMSHEIRTPMNAIIGIAELLQADAMEEHQRGLVDTIAREADSLLKIINDILDFSKLEAKKLDIERIPFDIREVLEESAASMVIRAEQKGLDLNFYLPPECSISA